MVRSLLILTLLGLASVLSARASPAADSPPAVPYPLQTCIVSGEHLAAGEMVVYVQKVDGKPDRIMHFCCRKCLARFKADPAKYLQKLDAAEAAKSAKKD